MVIVSQVSTVEKSQLGEYIGSLTSPSIDQTRAGMKFLQRMTKPHKTGEA
jgi:mRNA interferase MazF